MRSRVQVMGMISPNWVSRAMGAKFNERYFNDPEYRFQENYRIAKWLTDFDAQLAGRFGRPGIDWHPIGISGIGGVFDNPHPDVVAVGLPQTFVLIGGLFGAEIVYFDQDNPDVQGYPLANVERPEDIRIPDIASTWPVNLYLEQYDRMVDKYGRERVHLFFDVEASGLAMWFLHSPLTVAYRLRGEQLFIDMQDRPEMAACVLDTAMEVGLRLFRLWEEKIQKEVKILPMATCIAALISPRIYDEWEIPRLIHLAELYGQSKVHTCGPSTHVMTSLSRIPGLIEIEVGAGTDMALARRLWPNGTLVYLPDTPKIIHYTPDQMNREIQSVLEKAGDGPLTITWPAETGTPLETLEAIYETVADYNLSIDQSVPVGFEN